jgi:septal ring factor EnvC (AmiA/AmiB activator)
MKTVSRISPVDYCRSALAALEAGDRKAAKRLLTRLVAAQVKSAKDPSPEVILVRQLLRSTGAATIEGALATSAAWKRSHDELAKERAAIEAEKKLLEDAERRQLIGDLERLGAPRSRVYSSMPIGDLRDLHADVKKAPRPLSKRFQ